VSVAAHEDVMFITPEELLAGNSATFDVEIPSSLLHPEPEGGALQPAPRKIRLRPLTVKDIQLIAKAAKDDEVLTSVLMIQKAVVEPPLKQNDVAALRSGLVSFLVDRINHISGLTTTEDELRAIADAPIVQAFFLLAKEFNWTPQQVRELTIGQIVGYLEFLNQGRKQA
jgi:hypothetical protein